MRNEQRFITDYKSAEFIPMLKMKMRSHWFGFASIT